MGHIALSDNENPHFAWSELPAKTKSLMMICHDPDAPSSGDNVNKEGVVVAANAARVDFSHWVLVDMPRDSHIVAGEFSQGVTPRGKKAAGPKDTRQGLNNYTQWFDGDAEMQGKYFGYDGPCPPWNDELMHHYHFTLYAIDLVRCPIEGDFTATDVLAAVEGHVLDRAKVVGNYAINPEGRELP